MFVPQPPTLRQIERITPSTYEASIGCLAKAGWYTAGARALVPEHPSAILGTAFHEVVAAAHRGELSPAGAPDRAPARRLFDATAQSLYDQSHPLTKLKFPMRDRLPYYNLRREQAASLAARIASSEVTSRSVTSGGWAPTGRRSVQTEFRLWSADGLIAGRPDHVDGESQRVVDYKTGYTPEDHADMVSDSEARQLRLYAYLAHENRIPVVKGVIVRGNGQRCELAISNADALAEAANARRQLQTLNTAVHGGATFHELASSSREQCRWCPCIPFCESFWAAVSPDWQLECGVHVEGTVEETASCRTQGVLLTTMSLLIRRGSLIAQRACVEQIPTAWMTVQGGDVPRAGDVVRVVHGRQSTGDDSSTIVRVDKTLTSIWHVPNAIERAEAAPTGTEPKCRTI